LALAFAVVCLSGGIANAQWNSPNAYGTSTGYGTVYGSYGLAATMQSMYNVARAQSQRTAAANASGTAQSGSSSQSKGAGSSDSQSVAPPTRVVRNHGAFRPDATVDTGKAMAEALGGTPEEKALIKQIYAATMKFYEKEAVAKG
jgi:hypothetical protein